jgi:hypothetical protein
MQMIRQLITGLLILALAVSPAAAQSLNLSYPPQLLQQPRVSPALHPAAKGAVIGGAVGGATIGLVGLWYCTIGPSEVGECTAGQWSRNIALWAGVGAGIGALIGALR